MFQIDSTAYTPLAGLAGGALIGAAAGALALVGGKVMGCSGIAGGQLQDMLARRPTQGWRWSFLAGVLLAAFAWSAVRGQVPGASRELSVTAYTLGGLLVGFGTRLASGCTSGHGVCGVPRLARRSLTAVALFMVSGAAVVFLTRHGV